VTEPEQASPHSSSEARRAQILSQVEQQGYCTITELSGTFGVSDMTIRRDIRRLVSDSQLRSVHGGVTALSPTAMVGTDFSARASQMKTAKSAIAERAVELLPQGGAVALDAGTTTLELARLIPASLRLHVVTHSLAVINTLARHEYVEVTCLGGRLNPRSQAFGGPTTATAIDDIRVRKLFLAATGITANGVYCGTDFEAVTKRALVNGADEVVLLADSSKFQTSAMVRACPLESVDVIITDDRVSAEAQRYLQRLDAEIIVVSGFSEGARPPSAGHAAS
jgi:DeoR/GlpR family transcriptional regulator of sugar metabolism